MNIQKFMVRSASVYTASILTLATGSLLAQDIVFTNRTATFTNRQGIVFKDATLIKADLDGLIWRNGASGGRICYTNLDPVFLERLGVSSNRIAISKSRAEHKTVSDAQYLAARNAQAQLAEEARQVGLGDFAAKARDRQRITDQQAIDDLAQTIEDAQSSLDHVRAAAYDYNANPARGRSYSYVKNSATRQLEINEMRKQLRRMKADYAQKYSK